LHFQFGGSEAIITALSDEFKIIGDHREIFVLCLFSLYFVVGLASCSQGGFYFFSLLERYAAGFSILFAVFFEAIAVSWIYGMERSPNELLRKIIWGRMTGNFHHVFPCTGIDRFSEDIQQMIGSYPGLYWRVCWKFVAPIFILVSLADFKTQTFVIFA